MQRRTSVLRSRSLLPAALAAALLLACGDPRPTTPSYSGPAQETPAAAQLPANVPAARLAGVARPTILRTPRGP
jgi:hypothetical protein